jgi:hypothetical protein
LPAPLAVPARLPGFETVRLSFNEAEASLAAAADRMGVPQPGMASNCNILAISGGAAGGAFGAGVLVGLSRAGRRPKFEIVTGVSTGALMAPFAFLGSDWDDRLTEAYTGGHAASLWSLARLAPTLDGGLLRPAALDALIHPFIDAELVAAVAREHALGRRLLVATTDLDTESACIWDMGQIASRGGERALALFRQVLAASASLPGLFPPRRFATEADGVAYEEMHVDGGVAAPLFVMPEALLRWKQLGVPPAGQSNLRHRQHVARADAADNGAERRRHPRPQFRRHVSGLLPAGAESRQHILLRPRARGQRRGHPGRSRRGQHAHLRHRDHATDLRRGG